MSKQKKKRNKSYTGVNASMTRPTIIKVSAVNRTKIGQWWADNKAIAMPLIKTAGVIFVVIVLIIEIIKLING